MHLEVSLLFLCLLFVFEIISLSLHEHFRQVSISVLVSFRQKSFSVVSKIPFVYTFPAQNIFQVENNPLLKCFCLFFFLQLKLNPVFFPIELCIFCLLPIIQMTVQVLKLNSFLRKTHWNCIICVLVSKGEVLANDVFTCEFQILSYKYQRWREGGRVGGRGKEKKREIQF